MKTAIRMLLFPLLAAVLPAQRPWQQVTVPSLREAAANFKAPPHEYGAIQPFISWNGPDAKERMARIVQDLDRLSANGVFIVNMSPGRGEPKYLGPEHMAQVKFVVQEAAKRGMKRKARIVQDLDRPAANGVVVINMSPGRGEPKYLGPEHMAQVKFVVQEAATC